MSWNYRLCRKEIDGEVRIGFVEAYYDEPDGKVTAVTENFVSPEGDDSRELMQRVIKAHEKPILFVNNDGKIEEYA